MQKSRTRCLEVCAALLLLSASGVDGQSACYCAVSKSAYLTTASPSAASVTTVNSVTPVTSRPMPTSPGTAATFIVLSNSSLLSTALMASAAFNGSTPGYTFEPFSNYFTVPVAAGSDGPQLAVDLLVGASGGVCRPMPYLDQICVSTQCSGCNLNYFSASVSNAVSGATALSQRIFYPTAIANETRCAGQDAFRDFGNFRYIVVLPLGSPSPSLPYAFRLSIIGNFSAFSCPSRRRRSLDILGDSAGSYDDDVSRISWQLSYSRRAASSDCSCPVGQDPVFSSVRTVGISWVFPLRTFSSSFSNISSAEYMSLARESYYLLMDAVRQSTQSNLTSVVGDFFDIVFSSSSPGTRLSGKLSVRNDTFYSDEFLLQQLKAIIPGLGAVLQNLSMSSSTPSKTADTAIQTVLPAFAVALICLLCVAALAVMVIIILWRLNLLGGSASRVLQYKIPASTSPSATAATQVADGAAEYANQALGSSIDSTRMPVTAFQGTFWWQSDSQGDDSESGRWHSK